MSGRMRCWECKDEVSGVGGWGVKISQNWSRLASRGQNIEIWEKWFFAPISAHNYATFKPNLYLCWSLPLKGVLKTPKSIPKEMLYFEMGIIPLREIIRKKRLLFLHYILNQAKKSIIYKVFKCQLENRTSKDWITTVNQDLEDLNWKSKRAIRNIKNVYE